jgi:hypothetical protein
MVPDTFEAVNVVAVSNVPFDGFMDLIAPPGPPVGE